MLTKMIGQLRQIGVEEDRFDPKTATRKEDRTKASGCLSMLTSSITTTVNLTG